MAGGRTPVSRPLVCPRSAQADDGAQYVDPRITARAGRDELDVAQPWQRLLEVPVGLVVRRRRGQLERRTNAHEDRRTLPDQGCGLLEERGLAELRPTRWCLADL